MVKKTIQYKFMKNSILFFAFIIISFCFNSCVETGYIQSEPTYVEVGRPPQPSYAHIWISGDWVWQRQTQTYRRNNGYWAMPKPGRTFAPGHWESKPKGKRWIPGKWHK